MNDDYETPKWLKTVFHNYYDPCPLYSEMDGLTTNWDAFNFVNPPYSNPMPWVIKAIEESKKGKCVVMLLRVDTSTKWFAKLVEANAKILWFAQRIQFKKGSPNFASMLVILNGSGKK